MTSSRIILHIDFNSFFASVEQQANPFLRGKAIAVAGKGKHSIDVAGAHSGNARFNMKQSRLRRTVVTTASKEAKARGVKTAMSSIEALKICPDLTTIPGDPRKYSVITQRFLKILRRYADAVEQFSTDEAFADITLAAKDYFGATMLAQRIRDDIRRECGEYCTASIGIAPNKLVAKLACESMKPNGLTVIRPDQLISFVDKQPLAAFCGIGRRIEQRLSEMGITSVASLRKTSLPDLVREFKSYGHWLYAAARGLGDDHIQEGSSDPKSIGHSYTFPHDLLTAAEIQTNLLALCDKVAWRMRRDGFVGTTISAYVRYNGFGGKGRRLALKEPLSDGLDIYKNAWKLIETVRDPNTPIRLIGISVSGLLKAQAPASLLNKQNKKHSTLVALDKLQTKYGSGVWLRAATLNTSFKERVSGWHYDHAV